MADKKISQLTAATTPLAGTEVLPIVQSSATVKVSVANLTAGRAVNVDTLTSTGKITRGSFGSTGRAAELNGSNVLMDGAGVFDLIVGDGNAAYFSVKTSASATTFNIRDYSGNADLISIARSSGDTTLSKGNLVQGTAAKGVNFTANTPAAGMTSQLLNWYEEGTWTPNQGAGLTVVGAFSSVGTYTRIGRQVFIRGSVSGVTSVAVASAGAISTNLPYSSAADTTGAAINAANDASSAIKISSTTLTAATAIAATATITFSATYAV